eukprot:5241701-Alexandrium_andersonii.AAC.1
MSRRPMDGAGERWQVRTTALGLGRLAPLEIEPRDWLPPTARWEGKVLAVESPAGPPRDGQP